MERVKSVEMEEGLQRNSAKDRLTKVEEEKNAIINNLRAELSKAVE